MIEAKELCPVCDVPTRVVRYWSAKNSRLHAETACGHETDDEPFVDRCLSFEDVALKEAKTIHAAHADRCPCALCLDAK